MKRTSKYLGWKTCSLWIYNPELSVGQSARRKRHHSLAGIGGKNKEQLIMEPISLVHFLKSNRNNNKNHPLEFYVSMTTYFTGL